MAEKEKRILIDIINPGINCVYRLDNDPKGQSLCKHNGNMEPVTARECRHCDEGMTRQQAIERMAKALFKVDNVLALDIEFEQLIKQKQSTYKVFAAAALNALLDTDTPKDNKNQN